jgi:hypothetical protein
MFGGPRVAVERMTISSRRCPSAWPYRSDAAAEAELPCDRYPLPCRQLRGAWKPGTTGRDLTQPVGDRGSL